MLEKEAALLNEENEKLKTDNAEKKDQHEKLRLKISQTIQRTEINNLLREIDIEELQLRARNNKEQNEALAALITKWNYITKHKDA